MRPLSTFLFFVFPVIKCAEFHTTTATTTADISEVNNIEGVNLLSSDVQSDHVVNPEAQTEQVISSNSIVATSDPVSENIVIVCEEFDMMTLSDQHMRRCPFTGMIIPDDEPQTVAQSSSGKCPFGHGTTENIPLIEEPVKETTKKESKKEKSKKKSKKSKKKSKKHRKSKSSSSESSDDSSSSGSSLFSSSSSSSSDSSTSSSSTSSSDSIKNLKKKMMKKMPIDHGNKSDYTQCPYFKAFMEKKKGKK